MRTDEKEIVRFHVFADGTDGYFDTEGEAYGFYNELKAEGHTRLRIYLYGEDENGDDLWEEFLDGEGSFPHC